MNNCLASAARRSRLSDFALGITLCLIGVAVLCAPLYAQKKRLCHLCSPCAACPKAGRAISLSFSGVGSEGVILETQNWPLQWMQAPDSSIICFAYNIDPDGNPGVPVGSGYFLGYLYFLSGQWYIDFQFEPDEHGPFFGYTMIGTNGCDLSSFVVQYVNSDLTLQDGWQVRVVSP